MPTSSRYFAAAFFRMLLIEVNSSCAARSRASFMRGSTLIDSDTSWGGFVVRFNVSPSSLAPFVPGTPYQKFPSR